MRGRIGKEHDLTVAVRAGRATAALDAGVFSSLIAGGGATLDEMRERKPEIPLAALRASLERCVAAGDVWTRFERDGSQAFFAERGTPLGAPKTPERRVMETARKFLEEGERVPLCGAWRQVWLILANEPTVEETAKAARGVDVRSVLSAMRSLGWISYNGERCRRKENAPVADLLEERGVARPGKPVRKEIHERGAPIDAPPGWNVPLRHVSESVFERVRRSLAQRGEATAAELAKALDISRSSALESLKYLASRGAVAVRRGGLKGDSVDACGYVFQSFADAKVDASREYRRNRYIRSEILKFLTARKGRGATVRQIADGVGSTEKSVVHVLYHMRDQGLTRVCGRKHNDGRAGQPKNLWTVETYSATFQKGRF